MYEKLLISSGGGIVPVGQTSEQSDKSTNIFIGLGGTGKSCLKTIKKDLYTRLQSDNPDLPIKTYKNASFLCIDSDKSGFDSGVGALSTQEYYSISCQNISEFIQSPSLATDPAYKWFKSPKTEEAGKAVNIQDTKSGACGVRQAGRALFFQHATNILNKISGMVTAAKQAMPGATVKIHIFTGTGGGTGAGTFLDVCYLVRKMIQDNSWGDIQTFGYFFLPDVNLSNPELSNAAKESIMCTGYASMKELDYCMNFSNNGDSWNQFYGSFEIKTTEKPVDYPFLITATDANGVIQPDPYHYAMNVVSTFVMDFLIKQESESTIDTVISNIPTLITHVEGKNHGANYAYCVLGASVAYMPFADITTYLTSKLFAKFKKVHGLYPTDNDVAQFLSINKMGYDDILRKLTDRVPGVGMYAVDMRTLYDQAQACSTSQQYPMILSKMYVDDESRIVGVLETNKKALTEAVDRAAVSAGEGARSLINAIYGKLIEIAADFEKGPFFASAFLHTVKAKDITNYIDGYIAENNRRLSSAQANLDLRERGYGEALNDFKNSGALFRNRKGQALIESFHALCVQEVQLKTLQYMAEILTLFKKQVSDLYASYFSKFESLMRDLDGVFEANLAAFDGDAITSDDFSTKILSITDPDDTRLKKTLDDSVEEMRVSDVFSGFITYLAGTDEWLTFDEDKVVTIINHYFVSELKEYCEKTTESYLMVKYDTTNASELQKHVYNDIIIPTANKAAPLFWQSANYRISNASSNGYGSVPSASALVTAAAAEYKSGLPVGNQFQLISGKDPGRISFLEMRCGIPLFGYQGLVNYARVPGHVGRFLYEGSKNDERNWGPEYDIIPLSTMDAVDKPETLKAKENELNKAKNEYKVFSYRTFAEGNNERYDFFINQINEEKVNSMCDAINQQIQSKNTAKINELLGVLLSKELMDTLTAKLAQSAGIESILTEDFVKALKTSYEVESQKFVPAIGSAGYELICADDVVISYKALYDCMVKNTAVAEKRYNALKDAIGGIVNLMKNANMVQNFASALCCNVITTDDNYTFKFSKQNEFGLVEETELTNISTAPYGEFLPLYSAFVAYSALSNEDIQSIANEVRNKKVKAPDEVAAATEKVKTMFTDEKSVNSSMKLLQKAKTAFALQANDILKFVSEFTVELQNI